MPLSANTLIHFTKDKQSLKGILQDNFHIYNCRETVALDGVVGKYVVPMVSFCDIPLSEVKEHISKYGSYGLGMTKEWGVKNGLNPVLYVSKNSMISASYRLALRHFYKDSTNGQQDEHKALIDVARYLKNYEGELIRAGTTTSNYRYSDEREWRYVPPYTENCDMLLITDFYDVPANKAASDAKLTNLRLKFEPNDIKYIIINNDSEIGEFVEHLRRVKGKYFYEDIERLTTRILTTEQIMTDM